MACFEKRERRREYKYIIYCLWLLNSGTDTRNPPNLTKVAAPEPTHPSPPPKKKAKDPWKSLVFEVGVRDRLATLKVSKVKH